MKNAFLFLLTFVSLTIFNGCKKDETVQPEELSSDNLTQCSDQSGCNYFYANNAGMDGNRLLLSNGQYRVFWAQTTTAYGATSIYMMAPMTGDYFQLNKEDITNGKVKFVNNCASCFAVSLIPIDGKIIGQKVKQSAGLPEKWLVQADLTVAAGGEARYSSTVQIKQYYLPAN